MKKMKKRSNGFTLTELAIVIAVIAILIAVLVPTFISLIDKAKKTSDTSLVTNVNKVMSINETPDNINEALEIAESGGYKVENLTTASSGTLILWDETSNKFVYVNSELDSSGNFVEVDGSALTADKWTLWVITESYNSTYSAYSQYISGTISTALPTVSAGISVGNNTNIDVSYSGSTKQEVTFITNGGTLTINNASATVNHYGTATKVVVTAVASNSYHVYGKVTGNIEVTKGRVVLESSSDASSIYVSTSTASDVVVVNNSSNDVEIAAASSTVAAAVSTAATGSTTPIDSDVSTTTLAYFAGGFGTETSPYLIETAEQFYNIGHAEINDTTLSDAMKSKAYYFKLIADIDLNDISSEIANSYVTNCFQGELDGAGNTIYGLKTAYTYLVGDSTRFNATIKNVNIYQQKGYALTLVYCANRYTDCVGEVTFSDITVTGDKITTFGNNDSSFVNFVGGTVNFINCTNSVDIAVSSGHYFGIFIGGYAFKGTSTYINNITFDTCVNTAKVTGSHIGFFNGNANASAFYTVSKADFSDRNESTYYNEAYSAVYITNCKNSSTGDIESTLYCGILSETAGSTVSAAYTKTAEVNQALNKIIVEDQNQFKNEGVMKVSNADLSVSVNDNTKQLEISRTVDGTLSITYCVSVSYYKEDGKTSAGSNYVWVTFDVTNNNTYYVTAIIDGTADGYTYNDGTNNISYSSLTNALTENTDSSTDSYGHSYKLVAVGDGSYVIVVGVIKLMSDEDKTYKINIGTNNDKVYYTVSLTQNNVEIGTLIGKVSELAD